MQFFHCFCPFKGCTSSHGTWDQLCRQMTSLLSLDQMSPMGTLTCLSSGKQVILHGSAVPKRQPWMPTQSSVFILILPLRLPITVLFFSIIIFILTFLYFLAPSRLQEVNSMINKRLKDVLFSDQWSELCMDTLSPFGYVLVSKEWNLLSFITFSAIRIVVSFAMDILFFIHLMCSGGVPANAGSAAAGFL